MTDLKKYGAGTAAFTQANALQGHYLEPVNLTEFQKIFPDLGLDPEKATMRLVVVEDRAEGYKPDTRFLSVMGPSGKIISASVRLFNLAASQLGTASDFKGSLLRKEVGRSALVPEDTFALHGAAGIDPAAKYKVLSDNDAVRGGRSPERSVVLEAPQGKIFGMRVLNLDLRS